MIIKLPDNFPLITLLRFATKNGLEAKGFLGGIEFVNANDPRPTDATPATRRQTSSTDDKRD